MISNSHRPVPAGSPESGCAVKEKPRIPTKCGVFPFMPDLPDPINGPCLSDARARDTTSRALYTRAVRDNDCTPALHDPEGRGHKPGGQRPRVRDEPRPGGNRQSSAEDTGQDRHDRKSPARRYGSTRRHRRPALPGPQTGLSQGLTECVSFSLPFPRGCLSPVLFPRLLKQPAAFFDPL